jgi:enamine deaminase RidA (YjgF/YER057c/UK114 family)
MSIRRIESGPRMSQAVVHNGIAYLAGQVGAPGESVATQTTAVLAQIDRLLAEAGSDKSRILTATIWLADMADFAEMNSVWDVWVDKDNPPARATGEAKLATPDYRVEIIITAVCQ